MEPFSDTTFLLMQFRVSFIFYIHKEKRFHLLISCSFTLLTHIFYSNNFFKRQCVCITFANKNTLWGNIHTFFSTQFVWIWGPDVMSHIWDSYVIIFSFSSLTVSYSSILLFDTRFSIWELFSWRKQNRLYYTESTKGTFRKLVHRWRA